MQAIPGHPMYSISEDGQVWSKYRHRYLRGHRRKDGIFFCIDTKYSYNLGALLLMTFVGPKPEGHECCHNDGDGFNNQLSNLRWGTRKSNIADAIEHGTHSCLRIGDTNNRAKLTLEQCVLIKKSSLPARLIADRLNLHISTIYRIRTNRNTGRYGVYRRDLPW